VGVFDEELVSQSEVVSHRCIVEGSLAHIVKTAIKWTFDSQLVRLGTTPSICRHLTHRVSFEQKATVSDRDAVVSVVQLVPKHVEEVEQVEMQGLVDEYLDR